MNPVIFSLLAALLLNLSDVHLWAGSTTGTETINFGDYSVSNWRSADFKGSCSRQWDETGRSFRFDWKTDGGDQIGRIGVSYGSGMLGSQIDEIAPNCMMSTKATDNPATDHWFYWSIYGWTHSNYTYWGNTPKGWDNEFYVIFYTDKPRSVFLADKNEVDIGSVNVDGEIFDCYKTPRAFQSQWLAVRRSKTWNSSVNLKKIFDYWRSQGLPNDYVVDLGWALEGFQGSAGTLQLNDIQIPNLSSPASPPHAAP